MRVSFADPKLQHVCQSERELRRAYGKPCATKVMTRLTDLRAAASLGHVRNMPGRCHELDGPRKGQLGISLAGGRRLVLEPADGWPKGKGSGDAVWGQIDSVRVLEIVNYHDG
jgi:toxin HigB-1